MIPIPLELELGRSLMGLSISIIIDKIGVAILVNLV